MREIFTAIYAKNTRTVLALISCLQFNLAYIQSVKYGQRNRRLQKRENYQLRLKKDGQRSEERQLAYHSQG